MKVLSIYSLAVCLPLAWFWFDPVAKGSPQPGEEKTGTVLKLMSGLVRINAENQTVSLKKHTTEFFGNVVVVHEDLSIQSDRLLVTYNDDENSQGKSGELVKSMIFSGGVSIRKKNWEGHCDRAEYERSTERIICTGSPWMKEGENRVEGERIEYLLQQDEVQVTHPKAHLLLPQEEQQKGKKGSQPK